MKRILISGIVLCVGILSAQQAQKKPLTHDVYDSWKRISGESISPDGQWTAYSLEPQEGDAQLIVADRAGANVDTLPRGMGAKFSVNSDFCAFSIKPFYADIRKARIDKKKPADQPKDSLGILRLSDKQLVAFPRVMSFKLPEKGSGWIAYLLEKEQPAADSAKKKTADVDTTKKKELKKADAADAADDDKDKKDEKGTTLVLRNLLSGRETTFLFVTDYVFTKDGSKLLFSSTGNDSTVSAGVFLFHTAQWTLDTLSAGKGKYKQLAFDDDGVQAAFVGDKDTSKAKQRFYSLYYWSTQGTGATVLADTATEGFLKHWLVSENGRVYFSKDGRRLFFGTAPVPMPEDTTLYESETAKLDVWNWQDPLLQSQQIKSLDEEKKRSFMAVMQLKKRRFVQLGSEEIPLIIPGSDGNADVATGLSNMPYRQLVSWETDAYNDVYLIDMNSGERKMVAQKIKDVPAFSPESRYILWYDPALRQWRTYGVKSGVLTTITKSIPAPIYNELSDIPDDPTSYGGAGWTEGDRSFVVYDKYDLWVVDPTGSTPPVNVTHGVGRAKNIMFRYSRLDSEEKFFKPNQELLLRGFDYAKKSTGYFTMTLEGAAAPKQLLWVDADVSTPVKAKNTADVFFTQSTFVDYPDLYRSTLAFTKTTRLSDANPQQKNYRWGTAEKISWISGDGSPLDGLLFKPENFDPGKKYPMIVYFYERNSDLLNRYWTPAPSASTINTSVYVSNGYVVFIPDIKYRIGYPGQSAVDAIVPGTLHVLSLGFVDSARIGIQGQSWGGYQAAYLATHTHLFHAAGAGAAVSNMTSAYGGIRWESGVSRMFQYERDQSRIGGTLWEKPLLYIENSPLFSAPDCTTPLLLMNNDADGAVPWYQGIEFFTALRRLGKPVWMLVYNNEAHNLMERKNRKDLSVRMMQFFDHYLKDAPMPVWMKSGVPAIVKGKTLGLEY